MIRAVLLDIDNTLLDYMKTLSPREYTSAFDHEAKNLESGTKYWLAAVAIDKYGALGEISRLEVSTKAVEYSNVVISIGKLVATMKFRSLHHQTWSRTAIC